MTVRATFQGNFDMGQIHAALRDATFEMAQAIVEEAKAHCPTKTGGLRDSIHVESVGGKPQVVVAHPHAASVEFGHNEIHNGRKVGHVPAHPFLRPAIMKVAGQFGKSYGGAVGEAAGAYVGQALGPWGVKMLKREGRRMGEEMGLSYYLRVGEKVADLVEARKGGRFRAAVGLARAVASGVTARRGG